MTGHQPFLFVIGAGRSGTTLLRTILDRHPDLAIPGESYFVVEFAKWFQRAPYSCDAYLDMLQTSGWFKRWGLPFDEVRTAVGDARPATYADAVRVTYSTYAAHHGKTRYGDKTPSYTAQLRLLSAEFPDARFVHLVRDGRDVAAAMRDASFGPNSLAQAALSWQRVVRKALVMAPRLENRYLQISYEDFVADPAPVLERVCAFADLEFFPELAARDASVARAGAIAARTPSPHDHASLGRPIARVRDWRTDLQPKEVELLEALVGPTLTLAGYPLATATTRRRSRLRARYEITKANVRRRRRNLVRPLARRRQRRHGTRDD